MRPVGKMGRVYPHRHPQQPPYPPPYQQPPVYVQPQSSGIGRAALALLLVFVVGPIGCCLAWFVLGLLNIAITGGPSAE